MPNRRTAATSEASSWRAPGLTRTLGSWRTASPSSCTRSCPSSTCCRCPTGPSPLRACTSGASITAAAWGSCKSPCAGAVYTSLCAVPPAWRPSHFLVPLCRPVPPSLFSLSFPLQPRVQDPLPLGCAGHHGPLLQLRHVHRVANGQAHHRKQRGRGGLRVLDQGGRGRLHLPALLSWAALLGAREPIAPLWQRVLVRLAGRDQAALHLKLPSVSRPGCTVPPCCRSTAASPLVSCLTPHRRLSALRSDAASRGCGSH